MVILLSDSAFRAVLEAQAWWWTGLRAYPWHGVNPCEAAAQLARRLAA